MWKLSLLFLLGLCFAIGCNAADPPKPWDDIGGPADCDPYLSGKVVAASNPTGTFAVSIAYVEAGIDAVERAGPSCQTVAISSLCKLFFAEWNSTALAPIPACASNCQQTLEYCLQSLFLGATAPPPPFDDCSPASGWGTNPSNCVPVIDTALLPPSFGNETFDINNAAGSNTTLKNILKPVYQACDPFWSGQKIFVTDATPQKALALAALQQIGPLQEAKATGLTHACYDATIELVCKTAFLKPFYIDKSATPGGVVPFYLPHPPCKSVCNIQNDQCAQTFYLANKLDNLVNCSGPARGLTGYEQYPDSSWVFGALTLPCTQPVVANPEPTFRCESYSTSLSGSVCAPYITYPFWVPPATDATVAQFKGTPTQHALAKYIAPLLSAASKLPPYCQKTQIEFICKSAYQKCSNTPNIPVQGSPLVLMNFTFGGPPCRSLCDTNNDQCAQILSLSGNDKSITYCDSKSPATGLPSYPNEGYTFPPNIFVPCAESVVPRQPAPFSCEKFDGKPSVCSKYIDYKIMVTPQFDQKYLEKQVSKSLKGTEALPDACREPLEELACKTGFRKCDTQSLGGVIFNWGRRPCKKVCDTTVGQCGALFVLAGQDKSIPDCKAKDANDGQKTYPKDDLEYHAFGKTMKVKCVDLDGDYKNPPVRCTKYKGTADFCKKYINVDSVFENDLLPQETASSVVEQFNQLMLEASSPCRDYALNLACNVLFQECDDKSGDDFDLVLPKPPCRSACTDMPPGCKDYFKFYRIPVPDCSEKDPLTSQPRYPKSSWEFKFDKKKYETDCRKRSDAKAKIPS